MKQRLFITSTGTGIGKTFITASLARQARAMGHSIMAYKPVISGFNPTQPGDSDTGILLNSLNLPPTPENIQRISPFPYAQPLAPSMAARQENRPLDFNALTTQTRSMLNGPEDIILIEGVGGVMVPLTEKETVLDWIETIGIDALLVTGTYLGSLSHTLTALAVLEQRTIPVSAVILNESENATVSLPHTADELTRWTSLPIIQIKRHQSNDAWPELKELAPLIWQKP